MDQQGIEVYPVGLLSDIKHKRVWNGVKGYLMVQVKRRNWRAVRNYFNGYLAEWHCCPAGVRRLGQHITQSNLIVKGH